MFSRNPGMLCPSNSKAILSLFWCCDFQKLGNFKALNDLKNNKTCSLFLFSPIKLREVKSKFVMKTTTCYDFNYME